ncbi:FecR family protein [Mangrovibacterium lignilyticum]|uniref:FecR family protein n=1 Tax=Mangrovibacterium lignilyticum TaxID=2668052 RepID=UPI0013D65C69|nr:FecR domain-containing protein [Mangrovibacterium lignilyticum]
MKRRKQTIEWDIIHRKLKGEISEGEEQKLQSWLNAASGNRDYFEKAEEYYEKEIEELDPALVPDTTSQFLVNLKRRTKLRIMYRNLRVAASIVLPLLLLGGAWFTYQLTTGKIPTEVESSTLAHTSNKAQLITTSGKVLTLAGYGSELVDSVAGVHIANDSVMGLQYPDVKGGKVEQEAYNSLITPRGGEYKLVLSDGTRVWLNCESKLTYPIAFVGKERIVELKGEAYFEVKHNPAKPFRVKVNGIDVKVLGTHFNINAYDDEQEIKTTLLEGSVKVSTGDAYSSVNSDGQTSVVLIPGEQAIVEKNEGGIIVENPELETVMAWQSGFFEFEDTPLPAVMRQIGRWYDVDIRFEGEPTNVKFGGRISRDLDLDNILTLLRANGVGAVLEDGTLTITQETKGR